MNSEFSFADDTIGFLFEGAVTRKTVADLNRQILKKLKVHDTIHLYLEDINIKSFAFMAVIDAIVFPLKHNKRFGKIVFVTVRKWIHVLSRMNSVMMHGEVRNFSTNKRLEAINWIANK